MIDLAVAAVLKNEALILTEWLQHYIDQGVEKFFLIDNGSTDGCEMMLREHIDSGLITYHYDPEKHDQIGKYNKYVLPTLQETAKWLLVVDLDEFVYHRKSTLKAFVKQIPKHVGHVSVPWKLFGSSGLIDQPLSVKESFTKRQAFESSTTCNIKSFVRAQALQEIGIHEHCIKPEYRKVDVTMRDLDSVRTALQTPLLKMSDETLNAMPVHCNHYAIQSWRWFCNVKMTRGSANCVEHDYVRDKKYFDTYDLNDVVDEELKNLSESFCAETV